MTRSESHIAFKIETDKNAINIGMSGSPSFLPEEIDYWLYTALLSKIATKFTGNNTIQAPFEGAVKRVSDLEKLVKTDTNIATTQGDNNSCSIASFTNNGERMYYVSAVLHDNTGKDAVIKLISHVNADNFKQTYCNHPWIEHPVCVLEDDSLTVYYDSDLLTGPFTLDLTYVSKPAKINSSSNTVMDEIPEYMQYEVIKLAADMAIENIESPRVQTHPQYVAQLAE